MAEIPTTCPVCGGTIIPGDYTCKRCGFRLFGKTEAFEPVSIKDEVEEKKKDLIREPYLEVVNGTNRNMKFYLDSEITSIGRDPKRDIFLNDVTVSRLHAEVHFCDGIVTAVDKRSLNGVWVNGAVIDEETVIPKNGLLQIGTFVMALRDFADEV